MNIVGKRRIRKRGLKKERIILKSGISVGGEEKRESQKEKEKV